MSLCFLAVVGVTADAVAFRRNETERVEVGVEAVVGEIVARIVAADLIEVLSGAVVLTIAIAVVVGGLNELEGFDGRAVTPVRFASGFEAAAVGDVEVGALCARAVAVGVPVAVDVAVDAAGCEHERGDEGGGTHL